MALYAIHYAWLKGHGAKAPVGIWGEGGVSYYPPETQQHEPAGHLAKDESKDMLWPRWVAKRVGWGSMQGTSWDGVESELPMQEVLEQIRAEYFAERHPPVTFALDGDGSISDKEDSDASDESEAEEDSGDHGDEQPAELAARFVIAQSWWIASELARRHPQHVVYEMHPGGGTYDVLALFTLPHAPVDRAIMINRAGTLQVHNVPGVGDRIVGTWSDVLGTQNAHRVVKQIEAAAQLSLSGTAPKSTKRTLAYRFIACVLNAALNDRHDWDARNESFDSSGLYPGSRNLNNFLKDFPDVRGDLATTPRIGLLSEPESHFWGILRDSEPVAVVSIEGKVYRKDRRYDLGHAYEAGTRRMTTLVTTVIGDLLP